MATFSIDQGTDLGARAATKLRDEPLIWLTTVGRDGTPQPNPVWFLWNGADEVVVYNATHANRVRHIEARPRVALHFDGADGSAVVLTGSAAIDPSLAGSADNAAYQAKYGAAIIKGPWHETAQFARDYPHPMRIRLDGLRGH